MRDSSMPLSAREIYQGCRTPSINSKFSESPATPDLGPSSSARDFYQGFHSPSDWSELPQSSTDTEDDDGDHDQLSLTETRKNIDKIFRFPFTNSVGQRHRHSRADIENITDHFRWLFNHEEILEKVYNGKLADGTDFAVKMLSSKLWHSSDSFNQFKLMIEKFSGLEHKNLLRIMGYYFGKNFSALIMEYTPGGSLEIFSRAIFYVSKPQFDQLETEEDIIRFMSKDWETYTSIRSLDDKLLTWVQRIQIALDVAQGLEYLHHNCNPPVIHGNVKLSNILLDENLNGKLAEPRFGFRQHGVGRPWGRDQQGHFDKDVYDFGTVLWFLITGLSPSILKTTYVTADDMDRSWALPSLSLDTECSCLWLDTSVPEVLIDRALKFSNLLRILTGTSALQAGGSLDSVCLGIKIAGACTFTDTGARPAMTLVVNGLKACLNLARDQEAQSLADQIG